MPVKTVDIILKGQDQSRGAFASLQASLDRIAGESQEKLNSALGDFRGADQRARASVARVGVVIRQQMTALTANQDVQVAVEIAREKFDEGRRYVMGQLQRLRQATVGRIPVTMATDKLAEGLALVKRTATSLSQPIRVPVQLASDTMKAKVGEAVEWLSRLQRFRAVRIGIAATNGVSPVARAAVATLGPLLSLGRSGVNVAFRASTAALTSGASAAASTVRAAVGSIVSVIGSIGPAFLLAGAAAAAMAAAVAVGALAKYTSEGLSAIDATAKLADRMNISTEALVGLQHQADLSGVSNEQLVGGLEKLLATLGKASQGSSEAEDAFAALGLRSDQLRNMSPDAALGLIADRLKAIEDPAARARATMDIFGKSGQALQPLLLAGSEGIRQATEEAEKLGLSFSRIDAAQVEAANDAMTRLQAILVGVGRQLAIQVAPFIQVAAERLTGMATSGEGMSVRVVGAFEWVLQAIAKVADFSNLILASWETVKWAAAQLAAFVASMYSSIYDSVVALINGLVDKFNGLIERVNGLLGTDFGKIEFRLENNKVFAEASAGLQKVADDALQAANDYDKAFSRGDAQKGVTQFFADVKEKSRKAAEDAAAAAGEKRGGPSGEGVEVGLEKAKQLADALAKIQEDATNAGKSDIDRKIADLEKMGASLDQVAKAREQLNQANVADATKKLQEDTQRKLEEDAKRVIEAVKTPIDKYNEAAQRLQELLAAGKIDQGTYDKAIEAEKKKIDGAEKTATKELQVRLPDLVEGFGLSGLEQAAKEQLATAQRANDPVVQKQTETNSLLSQLNTSISSVAQSMIQGLVGILGGNPLSQPAGAAGGGVLPPPPPIAGASIGVGSGVEMKNAAIEANTAASVPLLTRIADSLDKLKPMTVLTLR